MFWLISTQPCAPRIVQPQSESVRGECAFGAVSVRIGPAGVEPEPSVTIRNVLKRNGCGGLRAFGPDSGLGHSDEVSPKMHVILAIQRGRPTFWRVLLKHVEIP